jgi:acetyltransferase-like isoleucine patch superfamily enzyme
MAISENLTEFKIPKSKYAKLGFLYEPLKRLKRLIGITYGHIFKEDQLQLACCCEPPMYFLLNGIAIPHAYGITLSVDEIGADCLIGQNVTTGTNGRDMEIGDYTTGHKPMLGHRVICYAGSVISGHIHIGDNVVIAANAFVDKNVPDNSFVHGINIIEPLKEHHKKYIKMDLWHCINIYKLVPGLVYKNQRLYIDEEYVRKRLEFLNQ